MRLSTAIKLGAMLKPQGFGALVNAGGRTCAIGAAFDAIGQLPAPYVTDPPTPAMWLWSWKRTHLRCPACRRPRSQDAVINVIAHLNDRHRWTREAIADWVATIEPQDQQSPVRSGVKDVEPVHG